MSAAVRDSGRSRPRTRGCAASSRSSTSSSSRCIRPESNHLDPIETLEGDDVTFLVAFVAGEVVGCGAVKHMCGHYGEIKRMYVEPRCPWPAACGEGADSKRSNPLSCDAVSGSCGWRTGCPHSPRRSLSLRAMRGTPEFPPFGDYPDDPLSVFFEKRLA